MVDRPDRIDLREDPDASLQGAVSLLRDGGVVAHPTETVYGFGSLATPAGIARLGALKGRADQRPFIVLVRSAEEIAELEWTDEATELASVFWPGSVTLVLKDPLATFPPGVRSDEGTVAVRVSPHPIVKRLLDSVDAPLTSTSLNRPGETPARSSAQAADVIREIDGAGVLLLDAGTLPESQTSTIIDCSRQASRILRVGTVPLSRLRCVIPKIHGHDI